MTDAFLIAVASALGAALTAWLLNKLFPQFWLRYREHRRARRQLWDQLGTMANEWHDKFEDVRTHMVSVRAHMVAADESSARFDRRFDEVENVVMTILSMTLGQFEMWELPSFLCDSNGSNINVNKAYARRLGVGRDDLMDYRYRNHIAGHVLASFLAAFAEAKRDHREFELDIIMCDIHRQQVHFRIHMIPFPRAIGPATRWIGTLTEINPDDDARTLT